MAGANTLELTEDNFQSTVSQGGTPILVDFWAPWCGPCKMIAPLIDQLADEGAGKYRVGKLNVDNAPTAASQFNIYGIPTMIVFKDGREVQRFSGAQVKKAELLKALGAA